MQGKTRILIIYNDNYKTKYVDNSHKISRIKLM